MNPKGYWHKQNENEHWLLVPGYAVYGTVMEIENKYHWEARVNYTYALNPVTGVSKTLEKAMAVVDGLMSITKTTE